VKVPEQLRLWRSEFGRKYTDRNIFKPELRLPAFTDMLMDIQIRDILEVGCNRAINLETLALINSSWYLTGVEPNEYARQCAPQMHPRIRILPGSAFELPVEDSAFDLVFTANVLIHISLADLPHAIDEIFRASRSFILVIEYFAEQETEIYYHGQTNVLWKRDFKTLIETQQPGLQLLRSGFHPRSDGMFDDSTWWLWKKVG